MKDINYIVDILEEIVNIPSPSGYTKQVMERLKRRWRASDFPPLE